MRIRHTLLAALCLLLWTSSALAQNNTISWDGKNMYLLGTNMPWKNYGTDFGTGGWGKFTDWNDIGGNFQTMQAQKVNTARWFMFADGRYSPEFNAQGKVTGLDSQFFTDVDYAMWLGTTQHVYLMPCLLDFIAFGGIQSAGGVTGGGHSAIITDPVVQQSYLDNALKPLLQHVAASPYRASILAYDICNEPEWMIKEIGYGGSLPMAQVQTFVKRCADYIHQYGGGAYATLGSGTPWWTSNWKGLGLDFYQAHYYPNYDWHDGGYAGAALVPCSSLGLDKPCIIGEFTTANPNYAIGNTTPLSAQWHLDTIYKNGYAGALGWSFVSVDSESDWRSFAPVLTAWANAHNTIAPAATPTTAAFVKSDAGTLGSWKGKYGTAGNGIVAMTPSLPAYATVASSGYSTWVWEASTTNYVALQKPASTTDRMAACMYSATNFLVDVYLSDGKTHQVSLYCTDYDAYNHWHRAQTIDVLDASTNAVLDSRAMSNYQNGVYMVWNIKGHVKFRLTNTVAGQGPNAVLSGMFFD